MKTRPLIKFLDSIIGRLGVLMLPVPSRTNPLSGISSILLIRPGGIGDAIHLIPAINAFRTAYPNARIDILAEGRNSSVFALSGSVDKIFHYEKLSKLLSVLWSKYDVVIDTEQSHRLSAIVARLVRAPVKIGFDTNNRRRMFTHCISYSQNDYEVNCFANLLNPLEIDSKDMEIKIPFLSVPEDDSGKVAELLKPLHDKPFMVLFPGASIPERRWGADRFRIVAEKLSVNGMKIVVVGGKEDRLQGEIITNGAVGLNLAGKTSLQETAAIIHKSLLLVSGDSGILHLAVGLGVPTVSLFGPGRAHKWAPRGDCHIVINKDLSCSPCTTYGTTPPCKNNVLCMKNITPDEVVEAVWRLRKQPPE